MLVYCKVSISLTTMSLMEILCLIVGSVNLLRQQLVCGP